MSRVNLKLFKISTYIVTLKSNFSNYKLLENRGKLQIFCKQKTADFKEVENDGHRGDGKK